MDPEVRLSAYVCGWVGEAGGRGCGMQRGCGMLRGSGMLWGCGMLRGCGMLLLGRNLSERHMGERR